MILRTIIFVLLQSSVTTAFAAEPGIPAPARPGVVKPATGDTPKSDDRYVLYRSDDTKTRLWFSGLLQLRYSKLNDDSALPEGATVDTFSLQRARFTLGGTLDRLVEFKIELNAWDSVNHELSPEEVYGDLNLSEHFKLRAGLFKPPVMLHRMMSSANQLFAEEAMVTSQKVTQLKGFDARKKLKTFPGKDTGIMVFGDLLPLPLGGLAGTLPAGFLRYYAAFQNGYDMKKGSGRGDAEMLTLRLEANLFGFKPYRELSRDWARPHLTIGFNYGLGYDLEIQDEGERKRARLLGLDFLGVWQGCSISGGWFVTTSEHTPAYERSRLDDGASFDPSWRSDGFFVQAAAFLPLRLRGVDLRRRLQFKLRFEEFDPFDTIGSSLYSEDMLTEFAPVGLNAPQDRRTRLTTLGLNWFQDVGGWKDRLMISLDYTIRTELEPFRDLNDPGPDGLGRLKNTQLRNNSLIFQLQLAM